MDNSVSELPNEFSKYCLSKAILNEGKVLRALLEHNYNMNVPLGSLTVNSIARFHDHSLFKQLVRKRGDDVHINSDLTAAAAGNLCHSKEVMELLLQVGSDNIEITSDLLQTAAENQSSGLNVLELFFDQKTDELHITSSFL